jgi:hypothetical protein
MNRFLAHPRLAVVIGNWLRCTCGLLGCTAMAGAITVGAAAPSHAATEGEPEPRRSYPPVCRHAVSIGDWYTAHRCREAWLKMHERSLRRSGREKETPRRADRFRYRWKSKIERRTRSPRPLDLSAPRLLDDPAPRPAVPDPSAGAPSSPTGTRNTPPHTSFTPVPTRTREQAEEVGSRPPSLQPVLLLGLLLPAAAAICYPFRHRIYAAATAGLPAFPVPELTEIEPVAFSHRPVVDPFAISAAGLSGPGASCAARLLALTALDEHGDDSLVVIPRSDAIGLFGLAEDELLDDDTAGLFIPGNLDAALAYLETELAIRKNTGATQARRLLLVADCAKEAERITTLITRHPGGLSAILLGAWMGDRASIDDHGLVHAPPGLASALPQHLPAISRTEARDRLLNTLAQHRQTQRPLTRRRSTPRRS